MILDQYELRAGKNITTFEFLSEVKKGKNSKLVQFQQMNIEHLYNLAFGNKNLGTGILEDKVITDIGNSEKIFFKDIFCCWNIYF